VVYKFKLIFPYILTEKRVQRIIIVPVGKEVKGGYRKLHNKELYNMYFSPGIIWVINSRWGGHVTCVGWMKNVYKILGGKPKWNTWFLTHFLILFKYFWDLL
jgi:hypothetical protein